MGLLITQTKNKKQSSLRKCSYPIFHYGMYKTVFIMVIS